MDINAYSGTERTCRCDQGVEGSRRRCFGAELFRIDTNASSSRNGHVDAIKTLKEADADVLAKDAGGWTPMSLAECDGHVDAIKALKEAGANVLHQRKPGSSIVNWFIKRQ